jgi:hypothetical protein
MSENALSYKAENGNDCEIMETFAEVLAMMEISPVFPTDIDISD